MNGNKFKELRRARGLTLEYLATELGTTKQTIHKYETGIITNIPPEKIERLASLLGTSPSELMGWSKKEESTPFSRVDLSTKRLPLLGDIACGAPIYANEEYGNYIAADSRLDADFCLRAHGDSMIQARIYDGDIVFIRSQSSVDNGDIAAVIIDDEATLKRVYFYPEDSKLLLVPENPKYAPLLFTGDELNSVKILGKAVAFQSALS